MNGYITRRIEPVLRKCVQEFPCVVLSGPRQSGKTTLTRHVLGDSFRYVSLDEPDVRSLAINDPRLFLETNAPPLIVDEIQYAPGLLSYVKKRIDDHREKTGQFILTGSQLFPLMAGVSESLAGRTAVLTLLPLSWGERLGLPITSTPVAVPLGDCPLQPDVTAFAKGVLQGGFPELALSPGRDVQRWYGGYVQTYLERDVRQIRNIGDLDEFQRFLRALAARHGQLLNMAELGRDLGLALNTVKAWISVLVAGGQVVLLRPYYRNLGKRLVKSPKVYFLDNGLVCYLTGVQTELQCRNGPLAGAMMEAEVIGELAKWFHNRGEQPALYMWRTSAGHEVDCVVEHAGKPWPIEVKMAATPKQSFVDGLTEFMTLFPESPRGRLVHLGSHAQAMTPLVEAVPFSWLATW